MRSSVAALATLGAVATVSAVHVERVAFSAPASHLSAGAPSLPQARLVAPLTAKAPRASFKKKLLHGLRTHKALAASSDTAVLAGSGGDSEYLTDITIGGQSFTVIVDTGSSDTWLVEKGFKCFNLTSYPEPTSECGFGSDGFDPSKSQTFQAYPNKNFNISYGDGEFLTGTVGLDTVTVGGLTVTSQEIGVVNNAAWNGDGVNSGLLGLAYPSLTSVYNGTDPNVDGSNNSAHYNPFFFTAIAQNKVDQPVFSVSLDRGTFANQVNSSYDTPLGYLAFGGVAPVNVTSTAVTVPVQGYYLSSAPTTKKYFYYNVDVDSYVFSGSTKLATNGSAILDTGTTLNYVPTKVAKAYNKKFSPAAKYVADEDTYYVDCNATAPAFSVTIGGVAFAIDGRDNILPAGTDDKGKELCISGTQNGGEATDGNIFILGDVFLHNVVATFNLVNNTIHLAQRVTY